MLTFFIMKVFSCLFFQQLLYAVSHAYYTCTINKNKDWGDE
ncbi:hypothetical protein HMPREF0556_10642 [Listeria grayi DSM 20601]|uniref:Uncharacterized protein n=1 Tax=Listeria grayi DSM 20601 TaxID=525367 RepID=D7UWN1_LISGR|nr:hypothetical protein HMPREF0556_10642 [Listeria grayi DSM 20601]